MLNWILIRFSRLLDWALVIAFVFALVFICQFLANFFTDPGPEDPDPKDKDTPEQ